MLVNDEEIQEAVDTTTTPNWGADAPRGGKAVIRLPPMEAAVRPRHAQRDKELISLARETLLLAESISEPHIYDRLIKIADELLDLARQPENSG